MLYTIEEETLTALGDVVRDKIGVQEEVREVHYEVDEVLDYNLKSLNLNEEKIYHILEPIDKTTYLEPGRYEHIIEVPNATSTLFKVWFYVNRGVDNDGKVKIGSGDTYGNLYTSKAYITTGEGVEKEYYLENENKLNILVEFDYRLAHLTPEVNYTFHIEAYGYDENGDPIEGDKKIVYANDTVKNTMMPLEMIEIVNTFPEMPPDIMLSGDCKYACAGQIPSNYIKLFGDTITTAGISNFTYMFRNYQNDTIPFYINCNSSTMSSSNLFSYANIKEVPRVINFHPSEISNTFYNCYYLKEIPEDFSDTWDWDYFHTYKYAQGNAIFYQCHSLRKIADNFLKNLWNIYASTYSSVYNQCFYNCYTLDEIKGLGVSTATYTSNMFSETFYRCMRLKDFTFETNADRTAKTANWKSQTIDLSSYIGYAPSTSNVILNYNSGITADKEVKDDATYQALKDDPDWWSTNLNYSRYNHDSAVRTLASLPDCSATGTNTIKFNGTAGALTDGGAINTLTEEEIAVATAKGWTVSLV